MAEHTATTLSDVAVYSAMVSCSTVVKYYSALLYFISQIDTLYNYKRKMYAKNILFGNGSACLWLVACKNL